MQGCESGRFIRDPDFSLFRIPDPTTATKEEGIQICSTYFCIHKYHKVKKYLIFEQVRKNVSQFTKNYSTYFLLKTLSLSPQKDGFGIRDQRSGILDPRSMRQEGTGTGIPDTDPKHHCNANSVCSWGPHQVEMSD
jgi:hypothetical protein